MLKVQIFTDKVIDEKADEIKKLESNKNNVATKN